MFIAKIVQMSGMAKEKTKFFFCHSRVQPILFKDSAKLLAGLPHLPAALARTLPAFL